MAMMKTRLTKQFVDQLKPGPKDLIFWDDRVRCMQLKLTPAGKKVWVLQYRTKDKTQRKLTLGYYPEVLPEEARRRATAALAEIGAGNDPMAERRAESQDVTFAKFGRSGICPSTLGRKRRRAARTKTSVSWISSSCRS